MYDMPSEIRQLVLNNAAAHAAYATAVQVGMSYTGLLEIMAVTLAAAHDLAIDTHRKHLQDHIEIREHSPRLNRPA